MTNFDKLPNIGKVLAEKLEQAGVSCIEEFKLLGAENAFLRVRIIDTSACIDHLYALEGAIQGIRWHNLSPERKQELKEFFNKCK